MSDLSSILEKAINGSIETLQGLKRIEPQIEYAAKAIEQCLLSGNKLLVCGNGGSASDAAHFATELVVRFAKERRAYPAICLTCDGGLLTAAGNDYGFEEIFARQLRAFGNADDLLIAISTSGKSKNVQRAIKEARSRNLKTIALLGRDGGISAGLSDVDLIVQGNSTARIQEAHKFILHVLCEIVDPRLCSLNVGHRAMRK